MVTILKPRRHKPDEAHAGISSENLPENSDEPDDIERPTDESKGIELGDDDEGDSGNDSGTGSAPGEGPNPTA